jgi:hypothetical protein
MSEVLKLAIDAMASIKENTFTESVNIIMNRLT